MAYITFPRKGEVAHLTHFSYHVTFESLYVPDPYISYILYTPHIAHMVFKQIPITSYYAYIIFMI